MSLSVNTGSSTALSGVYGAIFGSSSSSSSTILGMSTSNLGDYSLIKSGAYGKLLNAYYSSQSTSDDETDTTSELLSEKSTAEKLSSSLDTLSNSSLYKSTGTDSDGNATYDRTSILSAVQSYVDSYNSYIDSSDDISSTSILSKTVSITKATSGSSSLLSSVGITIGSDNKLTLDTTKLNSADMADLQALFNNDTGTYSNRVTSLANSVAKLANSTAYTNMHASSYTFDGTYSILGTTNGTVDTYS